jgi:SAM-dependent methyltransferase
LGPTPLANQFLDNQAAARAIARYPLDLAVCPTCSLVQIMDTVPPEELFSHYLYFSSYSASFLQHAESVVDRLCRTQELGPGSRVVEIASNDGYLLQYFKARGIPALGIEPAENVARAAREERGVETLCAFFGRGLAKDLVAQGWRADVVVANNVLAHVADLTGFVAGMAELLAPDGLAWIETPYLGCMVDGGQFDTIYHEHLCYYSVTALVRLFRPHHLVIENVDFSPFHGGSLCLQVRPAAGRTEGPAVRELLEREAAWGVAKPESYAPFRAGVKRLRREAIALVEEEAAGGRTVAAYGAAAKGTILLNVFGLNDERVPFVVDRNPHKQGRFVPGTAQPILPVEALAERRPDDLLILAWNFADEIMSQQRAFADQGGRFVIPIPRFRTVGRR